MPRFFYFAYGSNLLTGRLRARCPSARFVGRAEAPGVCLVMNKIGRDGSGKATLVPGGPGDRVFGALYDILLSDRDALDRVEGGYTRIDDFEVDPHEGGGPMTVTVYVAMPPATAPGLLPFDWYRDLIVAGACERGFPRAYVEKIGRFEARPDPDETRPTRVEALALLATYGTPSQPGRDPIDPNTASA